MAKEQAEANEGLSLEEISKLRGTAQEKSTEAIRAAEVRYHKAKQSGRPSLEEISKMRGVAQQNSMEAIRAAEERYHTVEKPKQ